MKSYKIIPLLLIFISGKSYCNKTDSLRRILENTREDTNQVNVLNKLSVSFFNSNYSDSSIMYSLKATKLAEKIGFEKGLADAYGDLANCYSFLSNYTRAIEYGNKSLTISKKIGYATSTASVLNVIGFTYMGIGDFPKSLEAFFSGLTMFRQLGNKKGASACLGNIALIYYGQKDYNEALVYDSMALEMSKEAGFEKGTSIIEGNIGLIYADKGEYAKALEWYKISLAISQKIEYKIGIAENYDNLGGLYFKQGDYKKALVSEFKTLSAFRETGKENDIATTYVNIGDNYYEQKNYAIAKEYYDTAFVISKRIRTMGTMKDLYYNYSRIDSIKGDYKNECKEYKNYIIYRDSLLNEATIKKTTQAEMNFEFNRKTDSARAAQDKLNVVAAKEKQRQKFIRNAFIGGFSLAFVASGIFFFQRRKISIERKKLKESNTVKDKLFTIISHDLRSPLLSLEATIPLLQDKDISEESSEKLTRNLENSMQVTLNMLDNLLQWSFSQMKGLEIDKARISLDEIIQQNTALFLNPATQKGITLKIADNLFRTGTTGYQLMANRVNVFADENIVRLIMRNFLNNAVKYTKCGGTITLSSFQHGAYAGFKVADTGIGIPEEVLKNIFKLDYKQKMRKGTAGEKSSGLGLSLCYELIQLSGGKIDIESAEGKGTTCKASFPVSGE